MTSITDTRERPGDSNVWMNILQKYGFATAIAVVLLYFVLGNVTENMKKQSDDVRRILTVSEQTRSDMTIHIGQMDKQQRVLTQICLNAAHTQAERSGCVQ